MSLACHHTYLSLAQVALSLLATSRTIPEVYPALAGGSNMPFHSLTQITEAVITNSNILDSNHLELTPMDWIFIIVSL
ncbi:MAG: hypothetical protein ACKVOQ_21665 [Cyclobacteriaceae bacterium]